MRCRRKALRSDCLFVLDGLESRLLLSAAVPTLHYKPLTVKTIKAPFVPAQILQAFQINDVSFDGVAGDGAGETIAIVDAYAQPTLASDTSNFNTAFNLPQFNTPGGPTLTVEGQDGTTDDLPTLANQGWSIEESLDVEWAHAVAPEANIVLYEAITSSSANLDTAVNSARQAPGVSVVSMSWYGSELSSETSTDSIFTTPAGHNGVTFLASSGDGGAPGGYPAFSPNVIAVGGTSLILNADGSYNSETGWADSGGGISKYEPEPIYQVGVVGSLSTSHRAAPDVAWISPSVKVFSGTLWYTVSGTSVACPMWAGLISIVDQGRALRGLSSLDGPTQTLPMLYSLPQSDFHDILSGNNGFPAGPGYDLVTGRGSPNVPSLVADMVGAEPGFSPVADFSAGQSPSGSVVADSLGNLFGLSSTGGENGDGFIYEITSGSGTLKTLASFDGDNTGADPSGTLLIDSSGDLFGTTSTGGTGGAGTVFEWSASSQSLTVLASFDGVDTGGNPSGLAIDSSGNVFGATSDGGVFEIVAGSQTVTVLATLDSQSVGSLAIDSSGDIFGVTAAGGANLQGEIFEIASGSGVATTLVSFNGANGSQPAGGLLIDSEENVYGTTQTGGTFGDGTIFQWSNANGLVTLASLNGTNGSGPVGQLAIDARGDLYGITQAGGFFGNGTVFEWSAVNGTLTDLHAFTAADGSNPTGSVTLAGSGNVLGVLASGGAAGTGRVFELSPPQSTQPVRLVFEDVPATTGEGSPITPAVDVDVIDAWGNILGQDDSSITIAMQSGPSGGAVTGTLSLAAVNGIATFSNVTLSRVGDYVLSATAYGTSAAASGTIAAEPGAPAKLVFAMQPTADVAGVAVSPSVVIDVEDAAGNIVTTDNSTVVLSISSGPAGASVGGTVSVTASGGVATFSNVYLTTVGTNYLKATDGALQVVGGAVKVTAGAPANLQITSQPTSANAGVAISPAILVSVKDAFGNLVTSGTVTMTIVSGPAGAKLTTATGTIKAGVATVNKLVFDTTGTYTLAATDGAGQSAPSAAITVVPGPAAKLVFAVAPASSAAAGASIAPTIDIEDKYGNLVTSNNSTVTMQILTGPGGGTIAGIATATASGGVATWSNLAFDIAGKYTLQATDGSLTAATTKSITITAGPLASLTILQQPSNVQPAQAATPAISVLAVDAFGNAVSAANITLVLVSGPTGGKLGGKFSAKTATNGVATFTDVTFNIAGNYILEAEFGTTVYSGVSNSVVVG